MKVRIPCLLAACLLASGVEAAPGHCAINGRSAAKKDSASTKTARRIPVLATAYSWRESAHRRWGCANRVGGRLDHPLEGLEHVAVDPVVIPLGSIIEVPGAGRRIATDTGGRIRGRKIDLHWQSVAAMIEWGTRSVTLTVVRWGWG